MILIHRIIFNLIEWFLIYLGIHTIWGKYKAGILEGEGKVQLMDYCETVLHGTFVNGKLHGPVRGLSFKEGQLTFIGRFKRGRPTGNCWKGIIKTENLLIVNVFYLHN